MKSRIIITFMVLIGLGVLIVPGVIGWNFYRMSVEQRSRLPLEKKTLKSSGKMGHGYGIAGSLIMLLNFLYLIRKRYGRRAEHLGNMRQWMHFHVFVGLVGPILIFYHTAFIMSNVFARISLIALLIVVATGIFGRFIYATIPRDINGYEQSQEELAENLQGMTIEFDAFTDTNSYSHDDVNKALEEWLPPPKMEDHGAVVLLFFLFNEQLHYLWRRVRGTKLVEERFGMSHDRAKETATLWLKRRRYGFLVEVLERHRKTLSSWRALHRTLTYLMVLTAVVHIFIATVGFGLL